MLIDSSMSSPRADLSRHGPVSKRQILGTTNRVHLIAMESPRHHTHRTRQEVQAYQDMVMVEARAKGAQRLALFLPKLTQREGVQEPYQESEDLVHALSYELDRKGDAARSMNGLLKQLRERAAKRSERVFRSGNDGDEGQYSQQLAAQSAAETLNQSPMARAQDVDTSELIVPHSLRSNPSTSTPKDAFVTTWQASQGDRLLDTSMQAKVKGLHTNDGRSARIRCNQMRIGMFASNADRRHYQRVATYIQQKKILRQTYLKHLHDLARSSTKCARKGLGNYNTKVNNQVEGLITSLWGRVDEQVLKRLEDPPV